MNFSIRFRSSIRPKWCRYLSLKTIRTQTIRQGGSLVLDLSKVCFSDVTLSSGWQDYCEISYQSDHLKPSFTENKESNLLTVDVSEASPQNCYFMTVSVPEYFDVNLLADSLHLTTKNKIQGDFNVRCMKGTISVEKIRGNDIKLQCGTADVAVKKLMEGNAFVQCRSFDAKMVNGDKLDINAEKVNIEAIYGEDTWITASDDITVGLMRGSIEAHSVFGNIDVKGIDGSFACVAEKGSIQLHVNKLSKKNSNDDDEDSFSENNNHAYAPSGCIEATLDPELAVSISCISNECPSEKDYDSSSSSSNNSNNSINNGNIHNHGAVTIISDAFSPAGLQDDYTNSSNSNSSINSSHSILNGYFTGKSRSIKRPHFQAGNSTSGKINLPGADAQSLDYNQRTNHHDEKKTSDYEDEDKDYDISNFEEDIHSINTKEYDITLASGGSIRVETMSWIQAIRSKYGFTDNTDSNSIKIGRSK